VTAIGGRPKPELCFLPGAVEVNALAQGALRQFTQWLWIEHPTYWSTKIENLKIILIQTLPNSAH